MGIRKNNKNHLESLALPLTVAIDLIGTSHPRGNDPLRFWTKGTPIINPTMVDLTVFSIGEFKPPTAAPWLGSFTGRSQLIHQLAPALSKHLDFLSPGTVSSYIGALRSWWRIFDEIEDQVTNHNSPELIVRSAADIGELHRQRAQDKNMNRGYFGNFVKILNIVRDDLSLPHLHWNAPPMPITKRQLPEKWQIDKIRFELKHKWYFMLDTWNTADRLLKKGTPQNDQEKILLKNYEYFRSRSIATNQARPGFLESSTSQETTKFYSDGFCVADMLRGFYPDASGIRVAFHLCLAQTGWNPSTLLNLDVEDPFLESHPKDDSRYVMRGHKRRGDSIHLTEGLYKSQGSAGSIIIEIMRRTAPLRDQLITMLAIRNGAYKALIADGSTSQDHLDTLRSELQMLREGTKSVWLYVSVNRTDINWLSDCQSSNSFSRSDRPFLDSLIKSVNLKLPPNMQLGRFAGSDFRDAFGTAAYNDSGGFPLHVMKALGHRNVQSTQAYIDNNIINNQSEKLYRRFSNALWDELKLTGRVDPTIIAKWSRDSEVTDDQRKRIENYRILQRSRVGLGCKAPEIPPSYIAPDFIPDGISLCPVQRCTLCEHAVVFPDSVSGLTRRMAELDHIQENMPASSFAGSSLSTERENTSKILQYFPPDSVEKLLEEWRLKIGSANYILPN